MKADGKNKKENPRWLLALQNRYTKLLKWVIHHRRRAIGIFFGFFVGTILLYVLAMKFILFPQGLIEEFFVRLKAPVGTSLEDMNQLCQITGDCGADYNILTDFGNNVETYALLGCIALSLFVAFGGVYSQSKKKKKDENHISKLEKKILGDSREN